jgi:hypothetical protein
MAGAGMIILGVDLSTVNWYYVIYVIFSICLVAGGIFNLYPMGTPRAVIYGVGAVLVCIFYGYRWFAASINNVNTNWPPTINTCPDYLTYVAKLPGDNEYGCVDMLGVSSNGGLQKSLPSDIISGSNLASTNTAKVIPYSSQDVIAAGSMAAVQAICSACSRAGVTWEGVWDGDVCTGIASWNNASAASSSQCS